MASSDRRSSLSPGERQRTKSQSSARSHRTLPDIIVNEDGIKQEKISSPRSKHSNREAIPTKRPESSTSNRSSTITSPTLNISRKQTANLKPSTPPLGTRRQKSPKRKKSAVSTGESERQQSAEPNDSEKQDLSTRGLLMIPMDIFERKFTSIFFLINYYLFLYDLFLVTTLRRLILSYNNLACLPPSIGLLINLEYLDISNNPLIVRNGRDDYSCIPREFRHLKNLHTLMLGECTLKHIPVAVWNTTSLQTLDLNRNRTGYIVSEIGK
jgi:Leucine-rich repeat (LRR) protein